MRYDPNLDIAAYHAHPAISRSGFMELDRTPRHYWWKYLSGKAEPEDTDALRMGQAFHTLVLEPNTFTTRFQVWSGADKRTKEGKAEYQMAEATGKVPVKKKEYEAMQDMAKSLLSEPASKKILVADGQIEPTYFWTEDGVDCKCRPDYFRTDGIILDVKTVDSASESAFQRSVINYYYDVQAYMNMRGIEAVTGKKPQAFVFVCAEKEAPYCCAFYSATDDLLAVGEARFHKLLKVYKECKAQDRWPGYGSTIKPLGVPEWFIKSVIVTEAKEAA